MPLALYTFADEVFVPGVVALINSARHHGFSGQIHVGSPEPLSICDYAAPNLSFHVLGPSLLYPGNRKAEFLLSYPNARFMYFDADMIVAQPDLFSKIDSWIDTAPVFSFEALIAPIDYRRCTWARRLNRPWRPDRWPIHYFSGGFFAGMLDRDRSLIEEWDTSIRKVLKPPGNLFSDRDFCMSDQDVLNAILQDCENQIIGIGPPDLDSTAIPLNPFLCFGAFNSPAILHGTGTPKPWAITATPHRLPKRYDLAWYEHAVVRRSPISFSFSVSRPAKAWLEKRITSLPVVAFRRLQNVL